MQDSYDQFGPDFDNSIPGELLVEIGVSVDEAHRELDLGQEPREALRKVLSRLGIVEVRQIDGGPHDSLEFQPDLWPEPQRLGRVRVPDRVGTYLLRFRDPSIDLDTAGEALFSTSEVTGLHRNRLRLPQRVPNDP